MCCVEVQQHRVSQFQILMYICYFTVICIPIQSLQSNQTRSTTCPTLIGCKYSSYVIPFYDLQYMYIYNLCCLRTIYAKYYNSTTK